MVRITKATAGNSTATMSVSFQCSDLASLRTRGEVTPDGVIVTGQKVWTSHGTHADLMFALIRTEPGSIGHRGITAVIIHMQAPGVTVRPIEQINGQAEFCEVFLDEVQVPMDHVVGGLGDGWNVAMSLLGDERLAARQARKTSPSSCAKPSPSCPTPTVMMPASPPRWDAWSNGSRPIDGFSCAL